MPPPVVIGGTAAGAPIVTPLEDRRARPKAQRQPPDPAGSGPRRRAVRRQGQGRPRHRGSVIGWTWRVLLFGISTTTIQRIWAEAGLKPHRDRDLQVQHRPRARGEGPPTSSGCTSPRPSGRSCLASTRRPRSRRSTGPSRCFRCAAGRSSATPTTTSATGRPACSRRSRSRTGQGHHTRRRARHTGDDFLAFLRRVERAYPAARSTWSSTTCHTHKTPDVLAWLARHPRITFHFTPTTASWMNQVETWFGILTRQAIRRGSFRSVKELIARIEVFTASWNAGASPFAWVKTADEILAKAVRAWPGDRRRCTHPDVPGRGAVPHGKVPRLQAAPPLTRRRPSAER